MSPAGPGWRPAGAARLWAGLALVWAAASLALGSRAWSWATGTPVPGNPARLVAELVRGDLEAGGGLWAWVAACGASLVAVPVVVARLAGRGGRSPRRRGDEAARLTGRQAETRALGEKAVRAKARRLGVDTDAFGLPIGRAVGGGRSLWSSFEDVCILVAGPRTGKTTCWVVPRIWAAPGLVVATSNKRDVLDATRQARSQAGRVWVFDPQGIAEEPQGWWWDILSYVTDAVQARALTQVFVDTTRDRHAQTSAYFDTAARDLVAALLLAAARGGLSVLEVYRWLTDPADRQPLTILREAGEEMTAQSLEGAMSLVAETRSGVYGSASTIVSFMVNEKAMRWVTPQPWLPELRPADLVASTDTLYCLSQEGRGSAAPIVTALTVAVTEAAVELARTQPGGRLSTPMLVELDEAANVCRWGELPDMYSHFGSRGIVVDTILQSWAQGAAAWGQEGVKKLWSAANQKVYGGGVSEKGFLSDLEALIGTHWVDTSQSSWSARGGSSSSRSHDSQQRQIATVKDLAELPAGRAWVLSSGSQAVLARMVPFWEQRPPGHARTGREAPTHDSPGAGPAATAAVSTPGAQETPTGQSWIR